jgi:hypothetical protein
VGGWLILYFLQDSPSIAFWTNARMSSGVRAAGLKAASDGEGTGGSSGTCKGADGKDLITIDGPECVNVSSDVDGFGGAIGFAISIFGVAWDELSAGIEGAGKKGVPSVDVEDDE